MKSILRGPHCVLVDSFPQMLIRLSNVLRRPIVMGWNWMDTDSIAKRILEVVAQITPEIRYEEKSWTDRGVRVAGTNEMLRLALAGRQIESCDVVFDANSVWMEVKHSWTWRTYRDPSSMNSSYRDHLFGEVDTSALQDARDKLPCLLGRPGVVVLAFLLIALDSDARRHPQKDIELLEKSAGLFLAPWRRYSLPRWKSAQVGYETIGIQPTLWMRPAQ